jgi:PAB-dependent poly(A)-specific ribonuclease subunit 2
MVDPLVRLFDLRMQRALPPVSFPGAAYIKMHPKMSAAAIIGSTTGQFQVVDVMNPAAMKIYNATVGSYISNLELAPTGDVLAMVDSEGMLQLWSSMGKTNFTEFGVPIDWPEQHTRPNVALRDDTYVSLRSVLVLHCMLSFASPLNAIGMPYFNEPLLSNWDPHMVFEVPKQPQQRIDPDTLAAASVSGYAPFHKRHPRNYMEKGRGSENSGMVPAPKFLSQQARDKNNRNLVELAESKRLYGDDSKRQFEVPPMYKKLEIKYSKFGVEDFDFA